MAIGMRFIFAASLLLAATTSSAETFVFAHLLEQSASLSQTPGSSETVLRFSLPPSEACASASSEANVDVYMFKPDGTPVRTATDTDVCFPCTITLGPLDRQASLDLNDVIVANGGYPLVPGPGYDGNGFDTYIVTEVQFALPEVNDEVLVSLETKTWTDVMSYPSVDRMKVRPLQDRVSLGANCRTFIFDHLLESAGTTSTASNFDTEIFAAYTDQDPAATNVQLDIYLFDSTTGSPFMDPVGANVCSPCTITLGPLDKAGRRLDDLLTNDATLAFPGSEVDVLAVINASGGNLDRLSLSAMTTTSRSGPNDLSIEMLSADEVAATLATGIEETAQRRLGLDNHPNPFNPRTTIRFDLTRVDDVVLRIVDSRGRIVRTMREQDVPAGAHELLWDGRDDAGREAPSGVYFAELVTSESTRTRKMALLR